MSSDVDRDGASGSDAYRAVFLASPDGILITDRRGKIRDLNPRVEELFGYSRTELLGASVEELVPREVRALHEEHRERYLRDPSPRPMGAGLELRGRRKDGSELPVEISLSPFSLEGEALVVATVRDLTRRRRLRRFGTGTLRAAEEERRKLARELHDDTAQRLASTLLRLRIALRDGPGGVAPEAVEDVRDEILETAESVRRIARGLRPPALEDVGLLAAIRAHVRNVRDAVDIRVDLEEALDRDSLDRHLDDDEKLALYRVLQEALSNALRHASAETVRVRLAETDGGLLVEVEDDGVGFRTDDVAVEEAGLGLVGMEERSALIGAEFNLDSTPGEGTRVRVEVPLKTEDGGHG